ncbi:hypothetical protein KHS38_05680 [Mucilaginibacter sp. Bleaf8]|uniref:hypothetical protein n=1 Tax=Mucilaginibacter sp. Bleaf8 TaxID=2834430 RepID=UPI001BCE76BB|nr:hypothetical protein [Mucilaginibacter sp. Bleaf8]MBS7563888.1 hypothetical protein [Mucilaginibacter sp. Bleaf8]
MKEHRNKHISIFSRALACLMVVLFVSISVVQAFHSHTRVVKTEQSDDDGTDEEYVFASDKCKLCDYYAHKHGSELHVSYPPVLTVPMPKAVTLGHRVYAGIYKFTLQGFTNKGPPIISC